MDSSATTDGSRLTLGEPAAAPGPMDTSGSQPANFGPHQNAGPLLPQAPAPVEETQPWLDWRRYVSAKDFSQAWDTTTISDEHLRYGVIEHQLAQKKASLEALASNLLYQKQMITEARRHQSPQRLRRHQMSFDSICLAASKVEKRLFTKQNFGNSNASAVRSVVVGTQPGGSVGLHVVCGLAGTRYYLGHRGGEHIFRHKMSQVSTAADGKPEGWGSLYPLVSTSSPAGQGILVYEGQVPRPAKELCARMACLFPGILQAIVSLLGFRKGEGSLPGPVEDLGRIAETGRSCPGGRSPEVKMLYDEWRSTGAADQATEKVIQEAIWRNVPAFEFAHILGTLNERLPRAGLLQSYQPIIEILQDAVGLSLDWMAVKFAQENAWLAARELVEGVGLERIILFEDPNVQDIHEYYGQKKFVRDPAHYALQYITPDVSDALKLCSKYWEDDFTESDPGFSQPATSDDELPVDPDDELPDDPDDELPDDPDDFFSQFLVFDPEPEDNSESPGQTTSNCVPLPPPRSRSICSSGSELSDLPKEAGDEINRPPQL